MPTQSHYSPGGSYDVLKNGKLTGRLVAGTFYVFKPGRGFVFGRVAGGLEGERFFYEGRPAARLVGNQLVGSDGTVLELVRVACGSSTGAETETEPS